MATTFDTTAIRGHAGSLDIKPRPAHSTLLQHRTATVALAILLSLPPIAFAFDPDPVRPPNVPPVIAEFTATYGPLGWTFEGRVEDEDPDGLTVTFAGILDGHETTVGSDGFFQYTVQLAGPGAVTGVLVAHTSARRPSGKMRVSFCASYGKEDCLIDDKT